MGKKILWVTGSAWSAGHGWQSAHSRKRPVPGAVHRARRTINSAAAAAPSYTPAVLIAEPIFHLIRDIVPTVPFSAVKDDTRRIREVVLIR